MVSGKWSVPKEGKLYQPGVRKLMVSKESSGPGEGQYYQTTVRKTHDRKVWCKWRKLMVSRQWSMSKESQHNNLSQKNMWEVESALCQVKAKLELEQKNCEQRVLLANLWPNLTKLVRKTWWVESALSQVNVNIIILEWPGLKEHKLYQIRGIFRLAEWFSNKMTFYYRLPSLISCN